MHRFLIAFAVLLIAAPAARAADAKSKCVGSACADIMFSADGCTITAAGKQPVNVSIFANESWRGSHSGVPVPVAVVLAAGASHKFEDRIGCALAANIEHMSAFATTQAAVDAAKPKKVDPTAGFFGPAPIACAGDACRSIELKEFRNCLWLQSSSERPITAELKLKAGATLVLDLEGADLAKMESGTTVGQKADVTPAECQKVMRSWTALEKLRASGTNVPPSPEIDGKVPACQALLASKSANAPETSYHHMIFSPLSNREYAIFRAKVETKGACVAKADLVSYSATYATKASGD